jgi:putative ABC transport system permease protein
MQNILYDVRHALRGFLRAPTFAVAVICSMALGIGANTAVFSVFSAILLRPFPYPAPDELVTLYENVADGGSQSRYTISPPDFLAWRDQARTLRGSAAYRAWTPNLTGVDQAERLNGLRVSAGFFSVLGIQPAAGRLIIGDDEVRDQRVVVISRAMWQRVFGGDPGVVGRTVRLNGERYVVSGVVPSNVQFPHRDIDVWAPLNLDRERGDREEHSLFAIARLQRGASVEQARTELRSISHEHEAESGGHVPGVGSLRSWFVGPGSRGILRVMLGAVGLLLLAACANVANLLLARNGARARELMIRAAIGATRRRLAQQLLTESLLLAVVAGLFGLLIATWSVDVLLTVLPERSAFRMAPIVIDWRILGYAFAMSLAAGLVFGVLPAVHYSRAARGGIGRDVRSAPFRMRSALLVAQSALAVTLMAGAGMLTRSFLEIWRIDPGFSADGVMTARITLPLNPGQNAGPAHTAFFEQVIARLEADPAIRESAAVTDIPLGGDGSGGYITIEGREALSGDPSTRPGAGRLIVTANYFRALGVPIKVGRTFTSSDGAGAPRVVIVNETMARLYWPDQSPIGRRIKRGTPTAPFPWLTVVGVAGNVRQMALGQPAGPMIYLPLNQSNANSLALLVKSREPDASVIARIRAAVRGVDPNQPIALTRSLDEVRLRSVSGRWLPLLWISIFAALALVLATLGVYGVVSYGIEQRRREFSIRLAVGARRSDVIRLAIRQGGGPALAGTGIGIISALVLGRVSLSMFGDVSTFDAVTHIAAAALLSLFALVASYLPARRITNDDAVLMLRAE